MRRCLIPPSRSDLILLIVCLIPVLIDALLTRNHRRSWDDVSGGRIGVIVLVRPDGYVTVVCLHIAVIGMDTFGATGRSRSVHSPAGSNRRDGKPLAKPTGQPAHLSR